MSIDENWETIRSLRSLCIRKTADCIDGHVETVKVLPANLKTKLLAIVSKRGNLSSIVLESLINPDIKVLDLSECNVDDGSLKVIAQCKHLIKLDLNPGRNQAREISSSALIHLFPNFPYLSILYLRRCLAVTDEVVVSIAVNCKVLQELDVGGCVAVSDIGILALVQGDSAESLTELHLEKCLQITDFAIESIILYCANIKILIFHGCPVSDASRVALETLLLNKKMKQLTWTVY
ncbi:Protein AMN1 [Blattella germanica]|nr:Protein AMN1 [Blattella germanica]